MWQVDLVRVDLVAIDLVRIDLDTHAHSKKKPQNIPSGPGVGSTSETSVAQAELFVARRTTMDGETKVYSLSN